MAKQKFAIDRQGGEVSEFGDGKNPLGTYEYLRGVRSLEDELVSIGGSVRLTSIPDALGASYEVNVKGHRVVFFLKNDGGTIKTIVGAYDENGDFEELEYDGTPIEFAEVRHPRFVVAPDAFFVTLGDAVHKFHIDEADAKGWLVPQADVAGLLGVIAIAFLDNRIHGITENGGYFTNQAAGGDCTTFATGDAFIEGGRYDTASTLAYTNIAAVSEKLVLLSPNLIEVKFIEEIQRDDGTGVLVSEKKLVNFKSAKKIGTRTTLPLPVWKDTLFFIDESDKKFNALVPEADQDNRLNIQEIKLDKRNIAMYEFDRWHGDFSNAISAVMISCRTPESVLNDRVLLFDPEEMTFSWKNWSAASFSEDSENTLRFTADNEPAIFRFDKDVYTDDGNAYELEIIMNAIVDPNFWQKTKIKRLGFWFEMSPEAVVTLEQSVDGGDWLDLDLDLSPSRVGGRVISPWQMLAGAPIAVSTQRLPDDVVGFIAGRVRTRAKGSEIRFRLKVSTTEKFALKSWGVLDYKSRGKRRGATIKISRSAR